MAEQERRFTRDEVAKRKKGRDTVFVIDNIVYDVTQFLDEHPGGHEVLQNVAGKDASEDFDDVGHSMDAKDLMKKYRVGEVVDEEKTAVKKRTTRWESAQSDSEPSFTSSWKFPVLLAIAATLLYYYLF